VRWSDDEPCIDEVARSGLQKSAGDLGSTARAGSNAIALRVYPDILIHLKR
jgi:hypothetical protein